MKAITYLSLFAAASFTALAADPKAELSAAAAKLAAASSYAWTSSTEIDPAGNFTQAPLNGKTEKDGYTHIRTKMQDNDVEVAMKAGKTAIKTQDGWRSTEEMAAAAQGGGGGRGGFGAARYATSAPFVQMTNILARAKEVKSADGKYSVDFTPENATALAAVGGRGGRGGGGGNAPAPRNASASATFWLKEGIIAKYELKTKATTSNQDGEDVTRSRTTTVEIKEVGTAKVAVPAEAKGKL